MIEALILIVLVAGIVYAAQRWPEIERRIFPGHAHRPTAKAPIDEKPEEPAPEPEPAAEPIAKGFMKKKPLTTEPHVEPEDLPKVRGEKPADSPAPPPPAPAPTEPPAEPERAPDPESPAEPETPVAPEPHSKPEPEQPTPGAHVTGTPARPSEPAYVNASASVDESVEDLAAEADQAYRERDYERAEQACLKILMREPRNHKYMTRIGQVYQEMGQLDDAKEAYESAKKLDPKNFFVLNRLAEVERQLSDGGGRSEAKSKED